MSPSFYKNILVIITCFIFQIYYIAANVGVIHQSLPPPVTLSLLFRSSNCVCVCESVLGRERGVKESAMLDCNASENVLWFFAFRLPRNLSAWQRPAVTDHLLQTFAIFRGLGGNNIVSLPEQVFSRLHNLKEL